ncbi:MAG: sulfite exporter TauE/SafE family protein [Anaerolineae bacterium]|nr:sulfite exporter TauE/SafE family protein [Anaerolineae bacterium]NUQ04994.1 sulfite exporter TauE/SafE family protein [Anaerolineae bacterium]
MTPSAFALETALGFGIGLSLGLLGGGGSILTVPALVYLLGQTPQTAVTTSLAIVGANSALGAFFHRAQGTLNAPVALLFGGSGMIVSYGAANLSKRLPPSLLMVAFAGLMLLIGALLIVQKTPNRADEGATPQVWKSLAGGAVVGLVTGILGVGGGFLIVPALVMLVGLPFHSAVGTSLMIIAMNSLAGFAGHLTGVVIDPALILVVVVAGIAGTRAGSRLARRLQPAMLRRSFALFVVALAILLLIDNLPRLAVDLTTTANSPAALS